MNPKYKSNMPFSPYAHRRENHPTSSRQNIDAPSTLQQTQPTSIVQNTPTTFTITDQQKMNLYHYLEKIKSTTPHILHYTDKTIEWLATLPEEKLLSILTLSTLMLYSFIPYSAGLTLLGTYALIKNYDIIKEYMCDFSQH